MAHHTSKCQPCLPVSDKVESWLYNNCYPNDPAHHHHLRSSTIQSESTQAHRQDDDESSVDTTKYIKSNRTVTRTKITSMTIKCYLSATVATDTSKSSPKIAAQCITTSTKSTRNANIVQPKRKRRVRYKTATSGKSGGGLRVTAAADSSSGDDPMIENRYSRRIAKRRQKLDARQ